MVNVAVIGGGAAGLIAAIAAAREGAHVTVFEADQRVGAKILKTGNGRCNLSNLYVCSDDYNDPLFTERAFEALTPAQVLGFFGELGLLIQAEEGRIYPQTNKASSVLDVLRLALAETGVEVCVGEPVKAIACELPGECAQKFLVKTDRRCCSFDRVILATGGDYRWGPPLLEGTLNTLHPRVPQEPVLRPLRAERAKIKGCSGLRVRCEAKLYDSKHMFREDIAAGQVLSEAPEAVEQGELQFKDDGVSGIMIFDLSRYARPGMTLVVDFFPHYAREEFYEMLQRRIQQFCERTARDFFVGLLQKQLAQVVLETMELSPDAPSSSIDVQALFLCLKNYQIPLTGAGDSRQAQVMRGGFLSDAFEPATLRSRNIAGFFVVGEALDIDGRCGGYNLHWAWTSGILAGVEAARR